jgi:hypothetical protein
MSSMAEYEVLRFQTGWRGFDYSKIKNELNSLGNQGWRVVGTHDVSPGGNVATEIVILLERLRS